jgi:predicted glutamine amidotransferase
MFGYVGSSRDELAILFRALRKSAKEDPLAPNQTRNQHRNGWGYIMYCNGRILHKRSIDPIFTEAEESLPYLPGPAIVIFHAREASSKNLTGKEEFQHPFRRDWEQGTIFLAHNGVLEDRLGLELSPPIDPELMVDSEIGLEYVRQQRRNGISLAEATNQLEDYTKLNRALNLLILEIPKEGNPQLFVKQFYKCDPNDKEDRTEYYKFNCQRWSSGGIAVFSSSLSRVEQGLKEASDLEGTELTPVSNFVLMTQSTQLTD